MDKCWKDDEVIMTVRFGSEAVIHPSANQGCIMVFSIIRKSTGGSWFGLKNPIQNTGRDVKY
ncbi:MAG: hypothetical protein H6627_15055 [Calditrichae bacterium]|nr:hypothetical protein [Calditrichia bacterium]